MKDYIIVDQITDYPFTAEEWRKWANMPSILPEGARVISGSFRLKFDGDKVEITEFVIHRRASDDTQSR